MKLFKKLLSYIIAVTMVLSLATLLGGNVYAAGGDGTTGTGETPGNSLTVKNTDNTTHTFELYQIFTGDYSNGILSNIVWGNGVTNEGKTKLGKAADKAKNVTDATAFANEVKPYLANPRSSDKVAEQASYTFDNLDAGYYLVKDKDGSQKDTKGAYTSYIVQVVGNVTKNTKLSVPTVEKKVKDTNESTGETTGWQDSADYAIGKDVPYQITGSMPDNIADYKTYKYEFTDTMSKGLTYTAKNAKIKIGDTDVTSSFTETVTTTDDGTTVTWTCNNLKGIEGVTLDKDTKVVVTYSCKLNEHAVIGSAGNPNTVDLTYSNNPNKGGEGETGKTPKDKNIVFTYKVVVNKKDQDQKSLAGAGFTLQKKVNGTYTNVKSFTAGEETTFEFTGLDDGDYKLIESTTPAGYNTITPVVFTISATHIDGDEPTLTSLSGEVTTGEATFAANTTEGSLSTDIVNKKGSTLPETGGMGTTLLYAAGGILVACAAAYVVLNKKRA